MIGKGNHRVVHIDLLGSVAGALSINCIAPATLQSVRDVLAENDTVTAMQEEIAELRAKSARQTESFEVQWHLHRAATAVREEEIAALKTQWSDELYYLMALTGDLWPQNETTEELARHLLEICPPGGEQE